MDIHRILCPIDFSDASTHAVQHAAQLALWYGARLRVLHVQPATGTTLSVGAAVAPLVHTGQVTELRERVAAFCAAAVAGAAEPEIEIADGEPVTGILEQATAWPASLVVMGTHGLSGFQHLVLGSVTEKVLRKAVCPVFTVPPRAQTTSRLPFRRVLCPVDFSDSCMAAARAAASLARAAGGELTLLHAIEWPWPDPASLLPEDLPQAQAAAFVEFRRYLEASARTRLDGLAREVAPDGPPPVVRVVHGKAYVEVLAAAKDGHADLIVMGVRGRRALDVGLFGSTTNQVVRRAGCPVLTVSG
jgi:nucleotide-binding universal stress UspA family protein